MKTNNFFSRFISIILVAFMFIAMIPAGVFATENTDVAEIIESGFEIDKVADGLDENDQTNVTLSVPGEEAHEDIDVIILLGGGMQANRETVDSAINLFKPLMEKGTTVKLGLISLEKGQEIIVDLNSEEAVLDSETYDEFITEKFAYIDSLPGGSTNLHSQLVEAKRMFDTDTSVKAENKFMFVMATGRTYWFDDANGNQVTIVNQVNGNYYWGNYLWQSQRGRHTSLYMIPDRYNNSYEAFLADIEKWVANDGDKFVFNPLFDKNDTFAYYNWYNNNNKDLRALGLASSRFGLGIVNPKPTVENFASGTVAAIGSANHPENALNYERAQYESIQVYKELVAAGYNCYALCSENPNYQNNSDYIKLGAKYTGTSTSQLGHSFMNYLAQLGGQENAPVVWSYTRDADGNVTGQALKENFFAPIAEDVVGSFYTCAPGSFVEDYIGYEEGKGNFEFIKDAACVKLNVGGVEYVTAQIEARDGADFSLEFTNPDSETASFWLDYYYGNGTTTEKFIWTFGENVTIFNKADLTYKLQLTEKAEVPGDYDVITNISATLYPTDSEGEEGEPEVFPIPEVNYTVLPISVSGHKIWNDNDNADNMRPDSITIRLFADGVEVDSKTVTEADGWEWTFEGLQQTNEGKEIVYTITEDAVEGYESVVDGFDVTNTYVPEEDEEIIEEEEKPELPETEEEETEEEIEEEKPEVPETEEEVEEPEIPETEEEVEEPEIPETEEEEPEEPEVEIEEPEIPLAPGTEPPQTGDSSSMIMWIAAAVVSTSLFVISSKKLVCASEEE